MPGQGACVRVFRFGTVARVRAGTPVNQTKGEGGSCSSWEGMSLMCNAPSPSKSERSRFQGILNNN